jgi:hypothetical protein
MSTTDDQRPPAPHEDGGAAALVAAAGALVAYGRADMRIAVPGRPAARKSYA